jgi:hypothetical protein
MFDPIPSLPDDTLIEMVRFDLRNWVPLDQSGRKMPQALAHCGRPGSKNE